MKGHAKVYAYQEWGSTKQNYRYDEFNITLPTEIYTEPKEWVSVLISVVIIQNIYIYVECLGFYFKSQKWIFWNGNRMDKRWIE